MPAAHQDTMAQESPRMAPLLGLTLWRDVKGVRTVSAHRSRRDVYGHTDAALSWNCRYRAMLQLTRFCQDGMLWPLE